MRYAALCLAIALFPSAASAQDVKDVEAKLVKARKVVADLEQQLTGLLLKSKAGKPKPAAPRLFKIGDIVRIDVAPNGAGEELRAREIVDGKTMVVYLFNDRSAPFVVRGHPTKGIADGQTLDIPGVWRVTNTVRIVGQTMFVVEPIGTPAKE